MNNFWSDFKKPFFALAPMEEVTDTVFRELVSDLSAEGKLNLVFSEFMSVDGFTHVIGRPKVQHRIRISEKEKAVLAKKKIKIVAQIWGSEPEKFFAASKQIASEFNFDGIDINMGCPVKKIIKHNSCSALIKYPTLAKEIILATKEGSNLPVSVKTRIGFNEVDTEKWISELLEVNPAAISIHGRTQKMKSEGEANWAEIRRAVELRDELKSATRIIGNGDVLSYEHGLQNVKDYLVDGIMVGRGIFKNPAFFSDNESLGHHDRINLLIKHISRFREEWEGQKNYAILKRFFKIYIHSFENATEIRGNLMKTNDYDEVFELIERSLKETAI